MSKLILPGILGVKQSVSPYYNDLLMGWNFNNSLDDISGNNNVLTPNNSNYDFVDGYRNKAIRSISENTVFTLTNNELTTNQGFTITCWAKSYNDVRGGIISASLGSQQLLGRAGGYRIHSFVNAITVETATNNFPQNTWTHVAASWNPETGLYQLYRNGINVRSVSFVSFTTGGTWYILRALTNTSRYFWGEVQELYVFTRRLSGEEITEVSQNGINI